MRKYQLYILSLLVVVITSSSFDVMAQKKKRKCFLHKKSKVEKVDEVAQNQIVIREPGVPNKQAHDSLKKDLMDQKRMTSALVVSFISMSSGIDAKSAMQLETMIVEFNKKNNANLQYDKKMWGREGERDYCIFSPNADWVKQFTTSVKKAFDGNRLIFVKENTPCRN